MTQITVIGLGYVGLPLAVLFASKYKVIGYDTNPKRVGELLLMTDSTGETDSKSLADAFGNGLIVTDSCDLIKDTDVLIVASEWLNNPIPIYKRVFVPWSMS